MNGTVERRGGEGRHILLAVEDSENSRRAVEYVAGLAEELPRLRVTILHVEPPAPSDFFPDEETCRQWREGRKAALLVLLDGYRRALVGAGLAEDQVEVRLVDDVSGLVADRILEEHRRLSTCTIVLGRHSKSRQEEFLLGSVTNRIVHMAKSCSVWVIC